MNRPMWTQPWLRRLLGMLVIVTASAPGALAQSSDVRFVEGLRARRLYDLASLHCREKLADSQLDALEQAELTAQLIRVYGEQAMHAAPDQRAQWWQAAHDVGAAFHEQHASHPRLLVVRLQDALVWCVEGELLRQEAEAARGDAAQQFTAALEVLRRAARALEQLDRDLGNALPAAPPAADGAVLTADELFALRTHVRLELARVYRNRGFCYPEGDDRIAAISAALEPLQAAISQLPADDPLAARARLEQAICHRLLGSAADAERVLSSLASGNSPPELAAAIRAEQVRAALAAEDVEGAMAKATQQLPPAAENDADFALARLEAIVATWQQSAAQQAGQQAAEWRSQAVALTQFIEQTHGAYWGRRAERLLLRSAAAGSGAGDVEILRRRADDLYLQSRLPEALAAYQEAADAAAAASLPAEEFLCRFRAALVLQQTGDLQGALQRLQSVALQLPTQPHAAAAHMEAIKLSLELARSNSGHLPLYEQLLLEHLANWAAAETADQVRLWLGLLYRHSKRWKEAIAVYTAVPPTSQHAMESLHGTLAAWQSQLQETADVAERAEIVQRAEEYFRSVMSSGGGEELAAQAAIAAARLVFQFQPSRAATVLPLLENARLAVSAADRPALRDEIESLAITALAIDPARQREAAARLEQWQAQDPQLVLALATSLSEISEDLPDQQQRALADLQLQLVARLRSVLSDAQSQRSLLRMEAWALAASGDRQRALAAFQQLAPQLPRDGRVQVKYAQLLERGGDPSSWKAALTQWSRVAAHSPERSDSWYAAKCGIARARLNLGKSADAAQLLTYLLEAFPPPSGSIWTKRIHELLAQCRATPAVER